MRTADRFTPGPNRWWVLATVGLAQLTRTRALAVAVLAACAIVVWFVLAPGLTVAVLPEGAEVR
jgi:hypothetical protein